jgi:flagellar biosynthesis protein FliP
VLTKFVPRFLVDEVIAECGVTERRVRLLPAHVVVYFVMALAIFVDGYAEVIRSLVHGLRFARTWSHQWTIPSTAAISQARER